MDYEPSRIMTLTHRIEKKHATENLIEDQHNCLRQAALRMYIEESRRQGP